MQVYDDDFDIIIFSDDDLLDEITLPLGPDLKADSAFSSLMTHYGSCGNAQMSVRFRITSQCSANMYGPQCMTECEEIAGQKSCNYLGQATCLGNFEGQNCDTCAPYYYPANTCVTFCDSTQGHYTCDDDGNRICSPNYYPETICNKFCEARDDALGHYTCDANGDKVCLEGYIDPNTNCVTCRGNFKEPDCDECDNNFQGANCDTCASNYYPAGSCTKFCEARDDALGHYTCDANGDKECLDGYIGPDTNCVTCRGNFKEPDCDECDDYFQGTNCDTCQPNYYPKESCDVLCIPQNNSEGHYKCNPVTGEIICLEGYEDPSTYCVAPVESGNV